MLPFSNSRMYSFRGACDYYLIAPTITSNNLSFSVIINFNPSDLQKSHIILNYGDLQLLSAAKQQTRSNLLATNTLSDGSIQYPENVKVLIADNKTVIDIEAIGFTLEDNFDTLGSEGVSVRLPDRRRLPKVQGLCGTADGQLVFNGISEVANIVNSFQIQRFAKSWILPPNEQTFAGNTTQCGKLDS